MLKYGPCRKRAGNKAFQIKKGQKQERNRYQIVCQPQKIYLTEGKGEQEQQAPGRGLLLVKSPGSLYYQQNDQEYVDGNKELAGRLYVKEELKKARNEIIQVIRVCF